MKILPILFLTIIGLGLPTFAQAPAGGGRAGGPGAMVERVKGILADLNLTADQQKKIDGILDQAKQDGAQLRSQLKDLSGQERAEKVRAFATSVKDKIEAELTPEQKETFDKKISEARAGGGGQGAGGGGGRLEQFRSNLDSLNLTDDQKGKIKDLLKDAFEKVKAAGNDGDRQTKVRDAMQDIRQKLSDILTPEQLQELRQKMQQNGNSPADRPAKPAGETSSPTTKPVTMMQDDAVTKPLASADKTGASSATPIASGQAAPDFKLLKLDGSPVQLSGLKGRPVVLVFGSYTCPTLRDRAMGLDRLYHDVEDKVNLFLVYTKEAHPVDGWEVDRNKLDNIQIQQPTSEAARKSVARLAHDSLHLAMPILMDEMDDTVTTNYGAFPNGAVVIGNDGLVFGSQQWAEPVALRHMIDEAVGTKTQ
jgi:Spy/CpxP family protein refolding chaperone